ncbi:site-specific integrase [Phytoactinopolyspora alkaliphila]|uniref:Site-specific integrase n=1 Tax=Phytoactinopolyspora alkaliphila TaxID=1783498 RepID=A0A6N9YNG6_9ACTN|nr:site-specific integrase [Phytoactinopolyspora alkaliphila]NED96485.1 site-specific integrase [Phytoactinopolyspora alkaliphila]
MWVARLDLGPGPDGKPRRPQRTSATENGAYAALDDMKKEHARHGDVPLQRPTVAAWLTRWLDEFVLPHKAPSTYDRYRYSVTNDLIPGVGRHRIDRLRPEHLRALYADMKKRGKAGSRPHAHIAIRKALNDAIREGLVMQNVAKLMDAPAGGDSDRSALTPDQGRALLRYVSSTTDQGTPIDRNSSRWAMALLTGVRQGECLGLTWDRVDLDARIMDISWQLQRLTFIHGCAEEDQDGTWPCGRKRGGNCPDKVLRLPDKFEYRQLAGGMCLIRPKSERSTRILPIPTPLYAAIKAHRKADATPNPHNLVWHREDGSPISRQEDAKILDAHLRAAGLPDIVPHESRHTTVTLLMEARVDPKIIQAIAGHASLAVQDAYKHADVRHIAEALGEVAGTLYLQELG